MKNIFNLDSPVMQFLTNVADLIILNVLYLVFCIPIVTIGASKAALYRVMLNYEKDESANPARQFLIAFRANLKPAIFLFLIMLAPMAGMVYYIVFIFAAARNGSKAMLLLCCIAVLFIMMAWSLLWPLQAQFENSIGNTIKNSLILSVWQFPRAVSMAVVNFLPLLLLLFLPELFLKIVILWVLFGFSLAAKMNTKIVLRIFKPFLHKEDSESTETVDGMSKSEESLMESS